MQNALLDGLVERRHGLPIGLAGGGFVAFFQALASSAERCAVARSWPDCERYASLSDGRVSAPKNDWPCGLITFVFPRFPRKMFGGTEVVFYESKSLLVK